MAKESSLSKWLMNARKHFRKDLHMCRVENSTMRGMPDVEGYLRKGGQFWIELKSADRPARASTPVRFPTRGEQASWLTKRWYLGGKAWMLCQVGAGHDRKLYLIAGSYAWEVHDGCTEEQLTKIASLSGRMSPAAVVDMAALL